MRATKVRLRRIQTHLGVASDGILGPDTLTAIENALGMREAARTDAEITPQTEASSLIVSRAALDLIVEEEIGSYAYYQRRLQHPYWPGGKSGVTIGIGYDLGFQSAKRIRKDWAGKISDKDIEKLVLVSGISGLKAKEAARSIRSVVIPVETAKKVFYTALLPRYAKMTLEAFPEADQLYPDAQGGLLSVVYNRGPSMKGERRSEMRAIRLLVPMKDYKSIAKQIRSMKRLWGASLAGLLKRRDREADLVADSNRQYSKEELIRV